MRIWESTCGSSLPSVRVAGIIVSAVLALLVVGPASGAEVVALASMVNRSGNPNPFEPKPYRALLEVDFPTWTADECPLCADGVPISKHGSRHITKL